MTRLLYRIAAEVIFSLHATAVLIIAFGWMFPTLYILHIVLLFGALTLQIVLRHCFLSRWEFWFRKKIDPSITYDSAYITHYMRMLFGNQIRPQFMRIAVPTALTALACIHVTLYWYTTVV